MNIFRLAVELFALYILYKLIFDFIIPIAKTTKQVKKQFNTMQSDMQEKVNAFNKTQQHQPTHTTTSNQNKPTNSDYIEFEEIK